MDHGQRLDLGDRELVLLKPPTYDAPETTGFFDTRTRVLFSVDSFGALLDAPYEELAAIPEETLRDGMAMWSGIDAPWLGVVDKSRFGELLSDIQRLDPATRPPTPNLTFGATCQSRIAVSPTGCCATCWGASPPASRGPTATPSKHCLLSRREGSDGHRARAFRPA